MLLVPSLPIAAEHPVPHYPTDILPSVFSWTNINGTDYSTPIKNQAPAPTCEAYALLAALETLVQYQLGYPCDIDLSEAHLFFYAGGTCDWGVYLPDAAEYLIEYGVPDEGCFPDPHLPYDTSFESIPGWENRTVKISEWGWVDLQPEAMKQALVEHGPLIICMLTRADFFRYHRGIYIPRGPVKGGHVITIFGYNDEDRYWLIRNSAGPDWGEDGWIRVSYDAHRPDHPFFWPFYGGTGVMYIDGVYGTLKPDVPQIYIEQPTIFTTYVRGRKIPTVFTSLFWYQKGAPRIFGPLTIETSAVNTGYVEFYVDDVFQAVDESPPYTWNLDTSRGLHRLEVRAYNNNTFSKDVIDLHQI